MVVDHSTRPYTRGHIPDATIPCPPSPPSLLPSRRHFRHAIFILILALRRRHRHRLNTKTKRYTFAALVLFLFTEPIRPKGITIPELLFQDFWSGLPVESGTHTNVRMAAIYNRHNKPKMD